MSQSEHPGVTIQRRTLLRAPLLLGAAAAMGRWGRLAAQEPGAAPEKAFQDFTKRWSELAARLLEEDEPNELRYVHRLEALLADLPLGTVPKGRAAFEQNGVVSGPAWFAMPVFVVQLKMEPGARIPAHNHPVLDVVSVGLEGMCRVHHFEPLDRKAAPDWRSDRTTEFALRATRDQVLTPGRTSALTRGRDNVHTFVAGKKGATILDFSTALDEGMNDFSYLDVVWLPNLAGQGIAQGRWTGKELPPNPSDPPAEASEADSDRARR